MLAEVLAHVQTPASGTRLVYETFPTHLFSDVFCPEHLNDRLLVVAEGGCYSARKEFLRRKASRVSLRQRSRDVVVKEKLDEDTERAWFGTSVLAATGGALELNPEGIFFTHSDGSAKSIDAFAIGPEAH